MGSAPLIGCHQATVPVGCPTIIAPAGGMSKTDETTYHPRHCQGRRSRGAPPGESFRKVREVGYGQIER